MKQISLDADLKDLRYRVARSLKWLGPYSTLKIRTGQLDRLLRDFDRLSQVHEEQKTDQDAVCPRCGTTFATIADDRYTCPAGHVHRRNADGTFRYVAQLRMQPVPPGEGRDDQTCTLVRIALFIDDEQVTEWQNVNPDRSITIIPPHGIDLTKAAFKALLPDGQLTNPISVWPLVLPARVSQGDTMTLSDLQFDMTPVAIDVDDPDDEFEWTEDYEDGSHDDRWT